MNERVDGRVNLRRNAKGKVDVSMA
jgi:hypothetical protein